MKTVQALELLKIDADAVFARIREDLARGLVAEARGHLNFITPLVAEARFATVCCDKDEDRMFHAEDRTWWRRVELPDGPQWKQAEPPRGMSFSSNGVFPNADNGERFNWQIELVPVKESEGGLVKPYTGTRKEAETEGDRFAESAGFEVDHCVLHRKGAAT